MQRILRDTCRVASVVLALEAAGSVIAIPAEAQIAPVSVNGNGHGSPRWSRSKPSTASWTPSTRRHTASESDEKLKSFARIEGMT
jgi:hypothetical protein